MSVNLCYTQKVREFQQEKVKYSKESIEIRLKCTKHHCPYCGATAVSVEPIYVATCRGGKLFSQCVLLSIISETADNFQLKVRRQGWALSSNAATRLRTPKSSFWGEIVL